MDGFDELQHFEETHAVETARDPVIRSLAALVDFVRNSPDQLELEIRVGAFGQDHSFTPGYSHVPVISKMMKRLRNNTLKLKTWTELAKVPIFNSGEYPNNVRKRVPLNQLITKRKLAKIDIQSDRGMGLRVCLSSEIPVTDPQVIQDCEKNAPISLRIINRASFVQKISFSNGFEFSVQYDISKVSQPAANKLECTKNPACYHCEVELKTPLAKLGDAETELRQNQMIAYGLLSCAKTFLGTHRLVENDTSERLPPPSLVILSQTLPK
jgi:hypothetical protein